LLLSMIHDRQRGRNVGEIARAFQLGLAYGLSGAVVALCEAQNLNTIVLSGGVFQNELLLEDIFRRVADGRMGPWLNGRLQNEDLQICTNHVVPPNDGGISLGQAAIAALGNPSV